MRLPALAVRPASPAKNHPVTREPEVPAGQALRVNHEQTRAGTYPHPRHHSAGWRQPPRTGARRSTQSSLSASPAATRHTCGEEKSGQLAAHLTTQQQATRCGGNSRHHTLLHRVEALPLHGLNAVVYCPKRHLLVGARSLEAASPVVRRRRGTRQPIRPPQGRNKGVTCDGRAWQDDPGLFT